MQCTPPKIPGLGRKPLSHSFGTKSAWSAIRDIQSCYTGLARVSSQAVCDSDDRICTSLDATRSRWQQYFTAVLNIQSTFDMSFFGLVQQRDPDESL